jgi:hypothetical protein
MGGVGSGNMGRKKFGNKFYNYTGGYKTKEQADHTAKQYEKIGIKTKVVNQIYYSPLYEIETLGWVIYTINIYHRPSKAKQKYRDDGSIDGRPRF